MYASIQRLSRGLHSYSHVQCKQSSSMGDITPIRMRLIVTRCQTANTKTLTSSSYSQIPNTHTHTIAAAVVVQSRKRCMRNWCWTKDDTQLPTTIIIVINISPFSELLTLPGSSDVDAGCWAPDRCQASVWMSLCANDNAQRHQTTPNGIRTHDVHHQRCAKAFDCMLLGGRNAKTPEN